MSDPPEKSCEYLRCRLVVFVITFFRPYFFIAASILSLIGLGRGRRLNAIMPAAVSAPAPRVLAQSRMGLEYWASEKPVVVGETCRRPFSRDRLQCRSCVSSVRIDDSFVLRQLFELELAGDPIGWPVRFPERLVFPQWFLRCLLRYFESPNAGVGVRERC